MALRPVLKAEVVTVYDDKQIINVCRHSTASCINDKTDILIHQFNIHTFEYDFGESDEDDRTT